MADLDDLEVVWDGASPTYLSGYVSKGDFGAQVDEGERTGGRRTQPKPIPASHFAGDDGDDRANSEQKTQHG